MVFRGARTSPGFLLSFVRLKVESSLTDRKSMSVEHTGTWLQTCVLAVPEEGFHKHLAMPELESVSRKNKLRSVTRGQEKAT